VPKEATCWDLLWLAAVRVPQSRSHPWALQPAWHSPAPGCRPHVAREAELERCRRQQQASLACLPPSCGAARLAGQLPGV